MVVIMFFLFTLQKTVVFFDCKISGFVQYAQQPLSDAPRMRQQCSLVFTTFWSCVSGTFSCFNIHQEC